MKIYLKKLAWLLPLVLLGCNPGADNYNRGVELQREGKNDEAEIEYKSALKANPDFAEAYGNLAVIYLNKEWYDGSIDCSKKAIEILERKKETDIDGQSFNEVLSANYNNLGTAQIQKVGQSEDKLNSKTILSMWDEALSSFIKATKIDPQDAEAQTNLKKYTDARETYVQEKQQEQFNNVLDAAGFGTSD